MKIIEREQTEAIYSEFAVSSRHLLCLAKTQRQAEGWESFIVKERGKASGVFWLAVVGKLEVSYQEAGHIMWLVWRAYLTFSVQSWLGRSGQNRKVGSHWPSPDNSGPIAAEVWFGILGFWIRVLLLYMVWSLSAYIFSTLTGKMWVIVHCFSLI